MSRSSVQALEMPPDTPLRVLQGEELIAAVRSVGQRLWIVPGEAGQAVTADEPGANRAIGFVPAVPMQQLGDLGFRSDHGVRYAYVTGAMANGIASAELVAAVARAGMLGFFGAAGLSLPRIEAAIDQLGREAPGRPWGFNLIHSPNEPQLEKAVVDLYLRRGVRLVEASAYMDLTLPLVRYRVTGISRDGQGRIVTPNRVVGKVSRVEVAQKFFSPPPAKILQELVAAGAITAEQAELAGQIPVAQDVTAEGDSGGHTDNRPTITLLPTLLALRDRLQEQHRFATPLRVGAAGGIATPAGAAAAFAMGAAYVVTGSINQACRESGSCDRVREMLAQAEQADTIMAPAGDMFEMGVKVQVLKRGTMFAMRGVRLYELYRTCASLDDIPTADRNMLEKQVFRAPLEEIWQQTREFFLTRDPAQVTRAEQDPKHKMALVFRWYLGLSSRWANAGEPTRQLDYQVWCGPAMGAFNEWTRGSFLQEAKARDVETVAINLLYGAAVLTRVHSLRTQGVAISSELGQVRPTPLEQLKECLS